MQLTARNRVRSSRFERIGFALDLICEIGRYIYKVVRSQTQPASLTFTGYLDHDAGDINT